MNRRCLRAMTSKIPHAFPVKMMKRFNKYQHDYIVVIIFCIV
jgi:hypothetical protein